MSLDQPPLEALVERAKEGDARALEEVVLRIKNDIFNLAVRMLWHPDDAEDATQEILLKIVTKLSSFRGESAFRTWTFRVATNHLLTTRRSRAERAEMTFSEFAEDLAEGFADTPASAEDDPEQRLLVEEVKIGCTQGMLLCLTREERVAYVRGEIFELEGEEAAQILDVTPSAFRKRLSRSRDRLRTFMRSHCGLVNSKAACSCARRVAPAIAKGRVTSGHLLFAGRGQPAHIADAEAGTAEIEELHRVAGVFRSHPSYAAPHGVMEAVRRIVTSGKYRVLD